MKTKFTDGPWEINNSPFEVINMDHKNYLPYEISSGCQIIAAFYELDADTNLIAAAPDMYKEIEQDILWLERLSKDYVIGSYELRSIQLRIKSKKVLLAKARGEK